MVNTERKERAGGIVIYMSLTDLTTALGKRQSNRFRWMRNNVTSKKLRYVPYFDYWSKIVGKHPITEEPLIEHYLTAETVIQVIGDINTDKAAYLSAHLFGLLFDQVQEDPKEVINDSIPNVMQVQQSAISWWQVVAIVVFTAAIVLFVGWKTGVMQF